MKRIILDILLFSSVFIFPWYLTAILAFVGLFIFENFYEMLVASFVVFAMYNGGGGGVISSSLYFPLIMLILFFGVKKLKQSVILYKK